MKSFAKGMLIVLAPIRAYFNWLVPDSWKGIPRNRLVVGAAKVLSFLAYCVYVFLLIVLWAIGLPIMWGWIGYTLGTFVWLFVSLTGTKLMCQAFGPLTEWWEGYEESS